MKRPMTTSNKNLRAGVPRPLSSPEKTHSGGPSAGDRSRRKSGSLLPIFLALGILLVAGPALFAWCYLSGSFTPWAREEPCFRQDHAKSAGPGGLYFQHHKAKSASPAD